MDRIQTQSVELDDRHVGFWREQFCDQILGADAPWSGGQRLGVQLDYAQRGGVISLDVHARIGGPTIERGRARVARDPAPTALGLTVVTAGACEVTVEGRTLELRAGDVCLLDSPHPFRKRMGADYRELFLYCPLVEARAALGRPVPALVPGRAAPGPLTALLSDTLTSVRRHAAALGDDDWPPLLGAVLGLAAAVFPHDGPRDAPVSAAPAAAAAWRTRVDRYIDDHLDDPALSPGTIAAALHVSVRYLHRLFEPTGDTVAAQILARRLERCRDHLLDPARRDRTITELAFGLGFNSAEHFSRAFRARFGVSARELRARQPAPAPYQSACSAAVSGTS